MLDEQKTDALDAHQSTTAEHIDAPHINGQLEQLAAKIENTDHLHPQLAHHEDTLLSTEHLYEAQDIHLEHAKELTSLHQEIHTQLASTEVISETKIDRVHDTHTHGAMEHRDHSATRSSDIPIPTVEQIAANRTAAAANTHEFISAIKQKPRNIVQKWLGSLLSSA